MSQNDTRCHSTHPLFTAPAALNGIIYRWLVTLPIGVAWDSEFVGTRQTLIKKHPIDAIPGHEEIAPKRKSEPGPAFPLDKLCGRMFMADRSLEDAEEQSICLNETGLVTASKLNIRASSQRSAKIDVPPLAKGSLVKILSESDGRYEVETRATGWVKKDYIETWIFIQAGNDA